MTLIAETDYGWHQWSATVIVGFLAFLGPLVVVCLQYRWRKREEAAHEARERIATNRYQRQLKALADAHVEPRPIPEGDLRNCVILAGLGGVG